jgi:hypothetical protein
MNLHLKHNIKILVSNSSLDEDMLKTAKEFI